MRLKIELSQLKNILSTMYFHNEGVEEEKKYWVLFKERFPNLEIFWRHFIVPATKRIEDVRDPKERTCLGTGVQKEITRIVSLHYSVFLALVYCYDHLQHFRISSFEDFYAHIVSALDLAEEFLLRVYLLHLKCKGEKSKVLQELTIKEFLQKAEECYNKYYSGVYENYLKKGKGIPIYLPSRKNVLDEYFKGSQDWKKYKECSKLIRTYRNYIIHNIGFGKFDISDLATLVPKKQESMKYKSWQEFHDLIKQGDPRRIEEDAIDMKEQMVLDIVTTKKMFNRLWAKPIDDIEKLFELRNKTLQEKYNIELL
ncbi:hypothetical protein ES703_66036 [subsurface metagenome]